MKKRLLACLLTAAMLVSLFPLPALAAEADGDDGGLCPHHQEHSYEVCGYIEAVEGQPCGHVHDGSCGYVEAAEEVPCNMDCAETDEDSQIVHADGCAYVPVVAGAPCQHEHDKLCGYVEAVEGQPCGYVCRICPVQAMIDALPDAESITGDNAGKVTAQVEDIGTAMEALTGAETSQLDLTRYLAAVNALMALGGENGNNDPSLLADAGAFTVDTDSGYTYSDGVLTITTSGTYTITGNGTATTDKIVIADTVTANVTLNNVNIDVSEIYHACAFEVAGSAVCNLTLQGTNTLKSGYYRAGLQVQTSASLTITAESTGSLDVTGGYNSAGIGGGKSGAGGIITISGGTVTATGVSYGAGIGGGYYGAGGTITINGGTVNATGSTGIGGGERGDGGNVTITGGTVTATGGNGWVGIGDGGYGSSGGTLTISGGTLKNTTSRGISFTMTGGTLDNCTIQNQTASVNSTSHDVVIKRCKFVWNSNPNITLWTDTNTTIENSELYFSKETTLTKGGTGNTYHGAVTIAGNAEFEGNTSFHDTVTISGDNASFSGNTTFASTVEVAEGKNVSLAGSTTLARNMTLGAASSLTNSGSLAVSKDCTIINRGTITNQAEAVIDLSGTINDEDTPKGAVTNDGTIFLIGSGQIIDYGGVTGNPPVPSGAIPIPAGEIVIDMSKVRNTVTIGPESYTIDGTSHTYDPAQNIIVLTGTYSGNISGTAQNRAAAVTVLENTTTSITLRDVNISWNDKELWCSSIWVKDYCTVTVFLEGTNTLKPRYASSGICTEEHSSLTVEGAGTLNLDLTNYYGADAGIGQKEAFGSITINGGNITTTVGSYSSVCIGGKRGTVTVNGGTLNGSCVFGYEWMEHPAEYQCVINGGVINSETEWSLYYGSLTINGGQMSIPTVYCSFGGKIAVNGGQLTLTSTSTSEYMYGNITINGGTVTGRINPKKAAKQKLTAAPQS